MNVIDKPSCNSVTTSSGYAASQPPVPARKFRPND
jgi:hypothetical protein